MKPQKEIYFSDVILARDKGRQAVNEASLGRVYQHIQKSKQGNSFAIITAYHYAETEIEKQKNLDDFDNLINSVRNSKLGFFQLKGHWVQCKDKNIPYEECPENQLIDVVEPSLFIPGISFELFQNLMDEFQQDGGIYSGPETNGDTTLFYRGGKQEKLGEFSPHKIAQAYSTLTGQHKHNFVFECCVEGFMQGIMLETWEREQKKIGNALFPLK